MSFGALLKEARERQGWTQAELAERLATSAATVSRWETEVVRPDLEQVNRLVALLPLSTDSLIRAMGANLSPPEVARLPRRLLTALLRLSPAELDALVLLVERGWQEGPAPGARGQ